MPPWEKYQSESAPADGPWSKYGGMATVEPTPEQPASIADKMVGGWGGRMLMGMTSPVLAATQMVGGDKVRAAVAELEAMKQRGMKAEGKEGFDWYGLLGSMVPGAGIAKGVSAALPAATSAVGRIGTGAAIGGATAAAQPVTTSPDFWTDKAKQVGIGTAVGGAVPAIGETVKAMRGAPQLNPVQAQTLHEGQAVGYVVPPSSVNPSFINNRLESVAGKAAVGQEAAKRNQDITNALAAKSLGMPKDTPLTESTIKAVRDIAAAPYREVSALSPRAASALDKLKEARFEASEQYKFYGRSGDPAARKAAAALSEKADLYEQVIEKVAQQSGKPALVTELRDARKLIAKTYDIERALNLGDANVSAPIIGRQLDKAGTAAKSGELSTIGKMAEAFPSVMREGARVPASGVSGTDAAASAILGTLGYGAGGPVGLSAAALPLLRGPARSLVLSPAYQRFATADPAQFQSIIDALAKQGAGAAGTAAGRTQGANP